MTELEEKFANLDVRQTSLETFMKLYANKTDEQIRLQRERMDKMDEKFDRMDAKIDALSAKFDSKFDSLTKFVHSMTITAMIGLLGIAASVVYFVYSVTPKP